MQIGEKIQLLRKSRQWSQEELASRIEVSRQALSKWELGSAKPDTDNVLQLSKLFAVSTDYLLYDDYVIERDLRATHKPSSAQLKLGIRATLSLNLIVWPLIGLFILGVLSVFKPIVVHTGARTYDGFIGFLMGYRLMWLMYPLIIMLVSGLLIALFPGMIAALSPSEKD